MIKVSKKFDDDGEKVILLVEVCDLTYFNNFRVVGKSEYESIKLEEETLKDKLIKQLTNIITELRTDANAPTLNVDNEELYYFKSQLSKETIHKIAKPFDEMFFNDKMFVSRSDEQKALDTVRERIYRLVIELEDQIDLLKG